MQVNRITWRSLYDLKRIKRRFSYNGNAGAEILHYCLTRYAIPERRRTEERKFGARNLLGLQPVLAGSHAIEACDRLRFGKKSTDAFWPKFQTVSSGKELAVKDYYTN